MKLQQASRKRASIKLGLLGPSGSGKTYSALLIAYGLTSDWNKVAVIDTENGSADLYSHLGDYYVLTLQAPFTPERYIEAIQVCLKAGIEAIIIDSMSHEWDFILQEHGAMAGNSFANWSKVSPRHEALVQAILQSPIHIIATIRSKQDYVLVEKNGKMVPEKVGMRGVQKENLEYEFTIVLELDMSHRVRASKDRTGLFTDKPPFVPDSTTGKLIHDWCESGADNTPTEQDITHQIQACSSQDELLHVYNTNPRYQQPLLSQFTQRRQQLLQINSINHQNNFNNGTTTR